MHPIKLVGMAKHRVCPWWLGYFLASPIRRWVDDSAEAIVSYAREGMTVLEPGPGMGFFTLELARRVGPAGRVVAPDIQAKMLAALKRRAEKAGLAGRIDTRLVQPDSMGLDDLNGQVDLTIACAVIHELEKPADFFVEVARALKPDGQMLILEPKGHVDEAAFKVELDMAGKAGLSLVERPAFKRNRAALLRRC
jgi:ubiquinone/menaquinone biosynthesis C-methylase UbiE